MNLRKFLAVDARNGGKMTKFAVVEQLTSLRCSATTIIRRTSMYDTATEWMDEHHDELMANWARLQDGDEALPIDPLK